MKILKSFDNFAAKVEQKLNRFDRILFVSYLSGITRIIAAQIQLIASGFFVIVAPLLSPSHQRKQVFHRAYFYILHSVANMARGAIAMLPVISLSLYVYDVYIGRMNYQEEKIRNHVYPLMRYNLV